MNYKMSRQSKKYDKLSSKLRRMLFAINPSFQKYKSLVIKGHILRPQYAFSLVSAVEEALFLGYEEISVLEFGCAGGSGLIDLECIADRIKKLSGVKIQVYGFDTGDGMPQSTDYRDLLYKWQPGEMVMNKNKLDLTTKNAKVVIGNVSETVNSFLRNILQPPSLQFLSMLIIIRPLEIV